MAAPRAASSIAASDTGYPTFPFSTLARFRSLADVQGSVSGLTDEVMSDSPYGPTALQYTVVTTTRNILPKVVLGMPVNVNGYGSIRITFKPIDHVSAGGGLMNGFKIDLFSSGTPASPPSNYHTAGSASDLMTMSTGAATVAGRWQTYALPIRYFTAVGSGADLSAITWARYRDLRTSSATATIALGDIDFVSNPRTKAALIFRFDDAVGSAYTIAHPLLAAVGKGGFLAPGAVASAQGINGFGRLTTAQLRELLEAGWQFGSQCYTTETAATMDGWTEDQRVAEWRNTREFAAAFGRYRDSADGSYFGTGGGITNATLRPSRDAAFRTLQRFDNGNPVNPPLPFGETFPFGDARNIRVLNQAQNGAGSGVNTTLYTGYALDQARLNRGVLILGHHGDLTNANVLDAFNFAIDYATNQYPEEIEITTVRDLLAPYL